MRVSCSPPRFVYAARPDYGPGSISRLPRAPAHGPALVLGLLAGVLAEVGAPVIARTRRPEQAFARLVGVRVLGVAVRASVHASSVAQAPRCSPGRGVPFPPARFLLY